MGDRERPRREGSRANGKMIVMGSFVQARNYTRVGGRDIDLVVIHTAEAAERLNTAEAIASWAAGPNAPRASWHYAVDSDSVVQSVRDQDVAWAAPGVNHNGLQIEHAGYARQTPSEWSDAYSLAMLNISADLVGQICTRYKIPVRWVSVEGLKRGERGITTHANVSLAFKRSDHTDPGKSFPKTEYLAKVRLAQTRVTVPPAKGPHWKWVWARWRLGEGEYRKYGPRKGPRPNGVPLRIPPHIWAWYAAFVTRRKKRR